MPPETQQRLKDTLPDCRIVVMPGLGHYPDEEDTDGFLAIVNPFLTESVVVRSSVVSMLEQTDNDDQMQMTK